MTVMKRKNKAGKLVSPNWHIEFTHQGVTRRETSGIPLTQVGGKVEAKKIEQRWRDEIDEQLVSGRSKATLGFVMTRYFNVVIKPNDPTGNDYHKKAKRILAHFGDDKVLDEITDTAIAEWSEGMQAEGLLEHQGKNVWVASKDKGLKPRSINAYLACLRAVLKKAASKQWNYLKAAPEVKMVGGKKKKVRYLQPEEASDLLKAALPHKSASVPSLHLHRLIRFLLSTGARNQSEALALTWMHVDFAANDGASVHFADTKTDLPRTVPIGDSLRDMLADMKREQQVAGYTGKKVFVYFKADKAIEIKGVGVSFRTARAKAGLGRDVTPHTLRHTYASWMLQDDVPLKKVSQLLGHASITVTADIYGHIEPKHLRASVDKLEARMTQLAA